MNHYYAVNHPCFGGSWQPSRWSIHQRALTMYALQLVGQAPPIHHPDRATSAYF
jgi:hypothetical protein